jgi:hypothetical protein
MRLEEILQQHLQVGRQAAGLLTPLELIALGDRGVRVFDPFSTLVSQGVVLGDGCILYPNTQLLSEEGRSLTVGPDNIFYPGCWLRAEAGDISIGSGNQFGEGGFTAVANRSGASLQFGSRGRFQRGAAVYAAAVIGDGCQILGPVAVQDCELAGGGDFRHPEPDERGAVLKGVGTARGLRLRQGEVIAGAGIFRPEDLKNQSFYHPKPAA